MKNVILNTGGPPGTGWVHLTEPHPGFYLAVVGEDEKRYEACIPVNGVSPEETVLTEGKFRVVEQPPRVVKYWNWRKKSRRMLLVTSGEDNTARCFLMLSIFTQCQVFLQPSTALILKEYSCAPRLTGDYFCLGVAAILKRGQALNLFTPGPLPYHDGDSCFRFLKLTWDGEEIKKTYHTPSEWEHVFDLGADDDSDITVF